MDLSRYIYLYYSDSNHTINSELWRLSNYPLFFFFPHTSFLVEKSI